MQLLFVILMAAAVTTTNVTLPGGKVLKVELATDGADIAKGLTGRESLPPDSGFLMAYRGNVQTQDHLTGYRFPVDILYIDETKTIINLKENAVPCGTTNCQNLSIWPYRYELQLPAGTIKRLNIHAGDVLSFIVPGEPPISTTQTAKPGAQSPTIPAIRITPP